MSRRITTASVIAVAGCALLLAAGTARAEIIVTFNATGLVFDYDFAPKTLNVYSNSGTTVTALVKEASTDPDTELDSVTVPGLINGLSSVVLSLTMTQHGANDWSATGLWYMLDMTAPQDGSANLKVLADFTSTSVGIVANPNYLQIAGTLMPSGTNPSLLVNAGSPWRFVGSGQTAGNGQDGVANQITLADALWEAALTGALVQTQFNVGTNSLDTLFGANRDHTGGWLDAEIITPAPAAIVLGFIGLCVVGWRMRKYA